jgi:hypothetical protein
MPFKTVSSPPKKAVEEETAAKSLLDMMRKKTSGNQQPIIQIINCKCCHGGSNSNTETLQRLS